MNSAEATAKWWADHLRSNNVRHDNGDPLQSRLATVTAVITKKRPTLEQIDAFEKNLVKIIESMDDVWLSVDYHPDRILTAAAEQAGFDADMLLPMKSSTWTYKHRAEAAAGYRNPIETFWKAEPGECNQEICYHID
jgi:hypothetical protein